MGKEKEEKGQEESKKEVTQEEAIHPIQRFFDNPWILLFLGVVVPTLSYTVWGMIEMLTRSVAKLP